MITNSAISQFAVFPEKYFYCTFAQIIFLFLETILPEIFIGAIEVEVIPDI